MPLTHEKLNKEIEEYLANGGTIKQVTTNPYKFMTMNTTQHYALGMKPMYL